MSLRLLPCISIITPYVTLIIKVIIKLSLYFNEVTCFEL
jgi:hypothetical protein